MFPFLDLQAQYATIRAEVRAAVDRVMDSQHFILGPEVEAFENEISNKMGFRFAVGCASGTDALLLSLIALEVGPGDEVITTPFTFVATAEAIARVGARPVFVDIDHETFNIDPCQIEGGVGSRTRAVIPVHLFGLPAEMAPILEVAQKHRLAVIEDAAQAIGAKYCGSYVGTLGTMGCFSFFPSKNLGGMGDGGLVTTNNPAHAERLRLLRVHGSRKKYFYDVLGTNSRLDALQAAVLRVKLTHLEKWTKARQQKAERFRALFAEHGLDKVVKLPSTPSNRSHVFNQFVIGCPQRDRLREFLRVHGVPAEVYYPLPLHLQPAFARLGYKQGQLPRSEAASREVLAVPTYPELSEDQQVAVVRAIAAFYGRES